MANVSRHSVLTSMASHHPEYDAEQQESPAPYTTQQVSVGDQPNNTNIQASTETEIRFKISDVDVDVDVEAGSWKEGLRGDDANTKLRGRGSTSSRRRTYEYVKDSQRRLGGARHTPSHKVHRSRERRRSQVRDELAAFDLRYTSQGNKNEGDGPASS